MASRHTEACRSRITNRLAADGDPRARREEERMAHMGEEQLEQERRGQEGQQGRMEVDRGSDADSEREDDMVVLGLDSYSNKCWDDVTREPLDPVEVSKARHEEIEGGIRSYQVYAKRPIEECLRVTGKPTKATRSVQTTGRGWS